MEKTKFVAQVLLIMTVIPVLFLGTIMGNDARIHVNVSQEHTWSGYTTTDRSYVEAKKRIAGMILSCGKSKLYVKK